MLVLARGSRVVIDYGYLGVGQDCECIPFRTEHLPQEPRECVGDAETLIFDWKKVFDCIRTNCDIGLVSCVFVAQSVVRQPREMEAFQARPHQTMEACGPGRNRLV